MNPDEPEADETTPEEEEWQLYATAGYAAAEDPWDDLVEVCLLYTSPSPRDATLSRMPSSA